MNRLFLTTLTAIALASAGGAQTETRTGETASASFVDADGQPSGSATLLQTDAGVLITLEVEGLPAERWVGFHLHEVGACDAEADHETAGGHFSPTDAEHGFLVEGGPHEGDMPNQYVPADGVLRANVLNTFVQLDGGETAIRGRSLLIHAEADDYESQPSGDAGERIACAVIE